MFNIYKLNYYFLIFMSFLLLNSTATIADTNFKNESNKNKKILFLGDSLTAGYGIDPEYAYPSIIQNKIDKHNLPYQVINAGVSGDTSAGGLRRLSWLFKQDISILVLALGANDGLRGFSPEVTRKNLEEIITTAREYNPDVKIILVGMLAAPNMGENYTKNYKDTFKKVSKSMKTEGFLPFLLEGVASEKSLNLEDGIHPNKKGHGIMAENVWNVLKSAL